MNFIQFFTRRKLVFYLSIFVIGIFLIPLAKGRVKPYYSGDTINFNNHLYIATTNTGRFELFSLENKKLYKKVNIMSQDNKDFSDSLFRKEGGRLFVYIVGEELFKYDITDPFFPVEVSRIKDNSGDLFFGVTKAGDKIATIGTKGVKIWNDNLQIINAYNIKVDSPDNLIFSENANYIYNYSGDSLEIIDAQTRNIVLDAGLDIADKKHNQKPYSDNIDAAVYVADDNSLDKIYFDGRRESFPHISHIAYDVASLDNRDYIYFSDGYGVVKTDKKNLSPLSWTYTTDKGARGGWAMGLSVLSSTEGDVVIVFNGSSILALDKDLNLIDFYAARDEDISPREPLSLSADKYRATPNSYISLRGAGFGPYEEIKISFSGSVSNLKADEFGRFVRIVKVPSVFPGRTDIKVDGERTGLTYSTSFEIE